jgi:class 3 adenylate cyclase
LDLYPPLVPVIKYATSEGTHIAYQTVGDGPVDLVYVVGSFSHLEANWDYPPYRSFCERLAEFSRVILFDKRGMGMSDRVPRTVPFAERMDDIRAVMDAAGSTAAAVMGTSEGVPLAALFAAAHPDRTRALILQGGEIKGVRSHDWPWVKDTESDVEELVSTISQWWGATRSRIDTLAPSHAGNSALHDEQLNRIAMNAASPAAAAAFIRIAAETDIRSVAPSVHVPSLIIHAVDDQVAHVENSRFLASTMPNAAYIELDGADHLPWFGDADRIVGEIREFLTGEPQTPRTNRVLTTVLFTDIVDSTALASTAGDRAWRSLLEDHNTVVRAALERFRGVEVNTTGDGFLATFDAPARAVACAHHLAERLATLGIEVRSGVHTGEVEVLGKDIAGIAVHIGARVCALAAAGEVLATDLVRSLVSGSDLTFADKGRHVLKGVPGEWTILEATRP